jgi:hypothetical protein
MFIFIYIFWLFSFILFKKKNIYIVVPTSTPMLQLTAMEVEEKKNQ